jgi:hypothetical protein
MSAVAVDRVDGCCLQVTQAQDTHQRYLGPLVHLDVVEHEDGKGGIEEICDDVDGYSPYQSIHQES